MSHGILLGRDFIQNNNLEITFGPDGVHVAPAPSRNEKKILEILNIEHILESKLNVYISNFGCSGTDNNNYYEIKNS